MQQINDDISGIDHTQMSQQDQIMQILQAQSVYYNERFNVNHNFEDLNKLKHGVLSRNKDRDITRYGLYVVIFVYRTTGSFFSQKGLEQRLKIRNYTSQSKL